MSSPEVLVYMTLLRLGGAKVSDIAKAAKLKRTTCQEYVRSIEDKGFINSTKLGNKYFYQTEDPDKFRQIMNERQFIVDRLIPQLRQTSTLAEWRVHTTTTHDVGVKIRRAKRREQAVLNFGTAQAGGALVNQDTVLLFSTNQETPAIEIKSKVIVELHKLLLKKQLAKASGFYTS